MLFIYVVPILLAAIPLGNPIDNGPANLTTTSLNLDDDVNNSTSTQDYEGEMFQFTSSSHKINVCDDNRTLKQCDEQKVSGSTERIPQETENVASPLTILESEFAMTEEESSNNDKLTLSTIKSILKYEANSTEFPAESSMTVPSTNYIPWEYLQSTSPPVTPDSTIEDSSNTPQDQVKEITKLVDGVDQQIAINRPRIHELLKLFNGSLLSNTGTTKSERKSFGTITYLKPIDITRNSSKMHPTSQIDKSIVATLLPPTTIGYGVAANFGTPFITSAVTDVSYIINWNRTRVWNGTIDKITQEIPWPVKKEAVVEGDIILGGLMMVHEREDSITCGPVMPQGGIQALEAMLFTLDQLNSSPEPLLPNITLGAHILDDCDKDTYGLEMAVDFIKGRRILLSPRRLKLWL